ncbi:MAG: alpha-amylase family glycosyl hydrolase [Thermodesulfobacteriota bacterium]
MKGDCQHLKEFHLSRKVRDLYQFNHSLFTLRGNVILPNLRAAKELAQKINEKRDLLNFPFQSIKPGQLFAMGLIDEILHFIVLLYRSEKNPLVMGKALLYLYEKIGKDRIDQALRRFLDEFPSLSLYRGEIELEDYLEGESEGIPNRHSILEEMLMLYLANRNPAFSPFLQLFNHSSLEKETAYGQMIETLYGFFTTQPFFGPEHQNLIEMLQSPAKVHPDSLSGQLDYIREKWGYLLGRYLSLLLRALDLLKEEEIAEMRRTALWTRLPVEVYDFTGLEVEPERFSPDRDWMPRLVLLAKNIYVWLHQLSRKYQRSIYRLDQIPDEELDLLSRWGFTGLWLIGVWERSLASKKIKELLGHIDAVASAYSLFEYQIAGDLGGEEAFQNLKRRASKYGIRLACDMVPNHMGIDSKWVMEHPDWFISIDESPFPSYRFSGPDLSWHEGVGIYIEDHYYDQTDAAVVFKRVDRRTGEVRFIYHGNDGTRMPWNDTAQLNFLKPEVREAILQTILKVAQKFPIIRFDAAMTLTKRHYQRLWYPEPGTGGAIPSRAEYGMTREEFQRHMPEEFWRQVVDLVTQEAPDTLLLAEAFWLLEGYFVRSLGMHRVYNSAFMNMLKDEENAKYRSVMKNTLEFNPEILKRFVNFMSNPDEETAISQFGKEDKYFGICTMMVTLPGLPMFAHGQIEGFQEKYGMEYRYAKWDEQPDQDLIDRHQREIFPLLKRRSLFSEVKEFLLYDFFTPEGKVNENVFAYSNGSGEDKALILYHNKFDRTYGWIRTSVAYSIENAEGRRLIQRGLAEGLGLHKKEDAYLIFRDHVTGLEYIRRSQDLYEKGLYVELGAYQYHVFLNLREIQDNEWNHYAKLHDYLNGKGVPSLEETLKEMLLQPLHQAFKALSHGGMIRRLMEARIKKSGQVLEEGLLNGVEKKMTELLNQLKHFHQEVWDETPFVIEMRSRLEALLYLPMMTTRFSILQPKAIKEMAEYLRKELNDSPSLWATLFLWVFLNSLKKIKGSEDPIEIYKLQKIIQETLRELGVEEEMSIREILLLKLLMRYSRWFEGDRVEKVLERLLKEDKEAQTFLGINKSQNILWFNKESYEEWLWWWMLTAALEASYPPSRAAKEIIKDLEKAWSWIQTLRRAEEESEYQVEKILEILKRNAQ